MDLFERLSRVFMRRKYSRVDQEQRDRAERLTKSKSVKIPRESRSERRFAAKQVASSSASQNPEPVVALPKKFTLRSSSNDVIDGAWFNSALRRSVAEGRVTLS
ncbi:hypothetical protein M758_1G190300 [Ceratodon purpureus]|uniref:Uncharacterized protein n=1 Tax=Ceratodon purpureus TaxID=3225 RepID=A0A8T0J916_CERPU|nr:hypothetical protein KC19_1G233100 [Ceratodon purpureus]KAG0630590.1 hypothetical protein M758_1G190300 [Ceratodon purpureus]